MSLKKDQKAAYDSRAMRAIVSSVVFPLDYYLVTDTVFSRLNAGGVYLKLGLVDPEFIRTQRLFGARRLLIKCIFSHLFFIITTRGLLN